MTAYNFDAPLEQIPRPQRKTIHKLAARPLPTDEIDPRTLNALRRRALVVGEHRVELNPAGRDIAARLSRLPNRGIK